MVMPELDHPAVDDQKDPDHDQIYPRSICSTPARLCQHKTYPPSVPPRANCAVPETGECPGKGGVTTSRKVAELFGKSHNNVLRAIDRLECDDAFAKLNYEFCFENSELQNGKPLRYVTMTKDGMVFLVMGFTGKQAAQFKLLYIRAFNWAVEQLYETLELQHLQHDFTRRSAISVSKGTFHGQGLARRRIEKWALSQEHVQLQARSQLTLELTGEDAA